MTETDAKYFRDLWSATKGENEELKVETQALKNKVKRLQEKLDRCKEKQL